MLTFAVERARAVPYAVSPLIAIDVRVASKEPIQALLLRSQVRIDCPARAYAPGERERLRDLFGDRDPRGLLWHNHTVGVPPFESSALVELELPVSYDFAIASTKYFGALADGVVPLTLLFSGSIFHGAGAMRVLPVPWNVEARFAMPIEVHRETLARYYPDGPPVALRRATVERLEGYKASRGLATLDSALESLLAGVEP